MKKKKFPTQREAVILSILINGEKYGREIRNEYEQRTVRKMPLGSLYTTLSRIETYGFVKSRMGESTHERGGNRRKYFAITGLGQTALDSFQSLAINTFGGVLSWLQKSKISFVSLVIIMAASAIAMTMLQVYVTHNANQIQDLNLQLAGSQSPYFWASILVASLSIIMNVLLTQSFLFSRVKNFFNRWARPKIKPEEWLINLSFWIPREYREAIIGDILEDCHELRTLGKSEERVRFHIIWQLVFTLILLQPVVLIKTLKQILSTK